MSAPDRASEPPQPSEAQLRAVVDEHAASVYRVALTIVHDPALADDVVQETLLKAWRKANILIVSKCEIYVRLYKGDMHCPYPYKLYDV